MSIKLQFKKETHIYRGEPELNQIHSFAKKAFKKLSQNKPFTLKYMDEENDLITVSCPEDLQIAIEDSAKKIPKLTISFEDEDEDEEKQEKQEENQQNSENSQFSLFSNLLSGNMKELENITKQVFQTLPCQNLDFESFQRPENIENLGYITKKLFETILPGQKIDLDIFQIPETYNETKSEQQNQHKSNSQIPFECLALDDEDMDVQQILNKFYIDTYVLKKEEESEKSGKKTENPSEFEDCLYGGQDEFENAEDSQSFEEISQKKETKLVLKNFLKITYEKANIVSQVLGGDQEEYLGVVEAFSERDLEYVINRVMIDPKLTSFYCSYEEI